MPKNNRALYRPNQAVGDRLFSKAKLPYERTSSSPVKSSYTSIIEVPDSVNLKQLLDSEQEVSHRLKKLQEEIFHKEKLYNEREEILQGYERSLNTSNKTTGILPPPKASLLGQSPFESKKQALVDITESNQKRPLLSVAFSDRFPAERGGLLPSPVLPHPKEKRGLIEYPDQQKQGLLETPELNHTRKPLLYFPEQINLQKPLRDFPEQINVQKPLLDFPEQINAQKPLLDFPEQNNSQKPLLDFPEQINLQKRKTGLLEVPRQQPSGRLGILDVPKRALLDTPQLPQTDKPSLLGLPKSVTKSALLDNPINTAPTKRGLLDVPVNSPAYIFQKQEGRSTRPSLLGSPDLYPRPPLIGERPNNNHDFY